MTWKQAAEEGTVASTMVSVERLSSQQVEMLVYRQVAMLLISEDVMAVRTALEKVLGNWFAVVELARGFGELGRAVYVEAGLELAQMAGSQCLQCSVHYEHARDTTCFASGSTDFEHAWGCKLGVDYFVDPARCFTPPAAR